MEKVQCHKIAVYHACITVFFFHSGQFGKIYKGLYKKPGDAHIDAGIEVAIKTIKKYDSKTEMENFLKEMSVMSMLIHPNVVRFYGLVQKGN